VRRHHPRAGQVRWARRGTDHAPSAAVRSVPADRDRRRHRLLRPVLLRPGPPPRPVSRVRFTGAIAGIGSTSGVRVVVGRWDDSPFGAFADVMVAEPDGTRVLLAPDAEVSEYV